MRPTGKRVLVYIECLKGNLGKWQSAPTLRRYQQGLSSKAGIGYLGTCELKSLSLLAYERET